MFGIPINQRRRVCLMIAAATAATSGNAVHARSSAFAERAEPIFSTVSVSMADILKHNFFSNAEEDTVIMVGKDQASQYDADTTSASNVGNSSSNDDNSMIDDNSLHDDKSASSVDATTLSSSIIAAIQDDHMLQDVTQWIKDNGAFVSDKAELRRAIPNDPTSVRGMFANDDIKQGEVIFTIPWHLIIHPPIHVQPDGEHHYDKDACKTIRSIYDDMHSDEPTPYGRYLKAQARNYLPALWTPNGQSLLSEVLGPNLPPSDSFEKQMVEDLRKECQHVHPQRDGPMIDYDDDLLVHAWMVVESRADDELMVPYYDMINHVNGDKYNTYHSVDYGNSFSLIANQDIKAGQELYASYNQCNNCGNRHDYFGTPQMFQSYGFVEDYPQRYVLSDWDEDTYRLKFDIERVDGQLEVRLLAPLCDEAVEFLEEELEGLREVEANKPDRRLESIPQWEWDASWQLFEAYLTAFTLAYDASMRIETTDEIWEAGRDWWEVEWRFADDEDEDEDEWDDYGHSNS